MKLLIVGDNESSIEFLITLFPSPSPISISTSLYSQAKRIIHKEKPDIILLDIAISAQTGLDICSTMRSFTPTPIIVLSVSNNPQYIAGILDAGADDFLVKPISIDMLFAKVNNILRRVNVYSQSITI
jgi:two-component system, OmpR family, KDP operon response regulator KdpE